MTLNKFTNTCRGHDAKRTVGLMPINFTKIE